MNGTTSGAVDAVVSEITASGGVAEGHAGDVADWSVATDLVAHCLASFGRIDGFVNNAAVVVRQSRPWLHTESEIRRTVEANALGTMFCSVAALRPMVQQGSGSVINTISVAALGLEEHGVYGATKGAIASWTYCVALDLAGTGVRMNAISPSAQTGMSAPVPGRHRAPPEAAAPMVLYLLSDLSTGVNGQVLRIAGSKIATLAPPHFRDPLEAEHWTVDAIADAAGTTLKDQLESVGLDRSRHPEFAR